MIVVLLALYLYILCGMLTALFVRWIIRETPSILVSIFWPCTIGVILGCAIAAAVLCFADWLSGTEEKEEDDA